MKVSTVEDHVSGAEVPGGTDHPIVLHRQNIEKPDESRSIFIRSE